MPRSVRSLPATPVWYAPRPLRRRLLSCRWSSGPFSRARAPTSPVPGRAASHPARHRKLHRKLLDRLCLLELLHTAGQLQDADVLVVGVTGLRIDDDLLADHGVGLRDRDAVPAEDRVVDALAGSIGLLDGRQDDLNSRDGVQRVARRGVCAVLGLVGVEELRRTAAVRPQRLRVETGEREVHPLTLLLLLQVRV